MNASTVYTIGHSNHTQEYFLELLALHRIGAVCDVRSAPYSRVHAQFNREEIKAALEARGIRYVYLGKELGARAEDRDCYVEGKVQYERLARTTLFKKGLDRVQDGQTKYRLTLMCAEKEPLDCHRTILVARYLAERGVPVTHIHASGTLETQAQILDRLIYQLNLAQSHLFQPREDLIVAAYREQEKRIAYQRPEAAVAALG